ncbi:sulfatase family protein [Halopiger goleimassiliensis]|uniref:sulfatase family protein n=1 Tax=Halopiger goleimassiliensis TaxID=1293048 RepID=UPI0009DBB283|nr:sulfatase-like hydrolase/transferase [Halopiger goleimassiliensis]
MNVVVIVVDALRTDRVACYGGRPVTPTIEEIASEGTVFERAYTTINATDPALTSLTTGQLPQTHGVRNHGSHVTAEEKRRVESVESLPQVLDREGYATGAFGRPLGRWHQRGFSRYPELSDMHWYRQAAENVISSALYGVHPAIGETISSIYNKLTGGKDNEDEDEIVAEFESFVEGNDEFFALVHLMDTHTPYDVDPELVEAYLEEYEYDNQPLSELRDEFPSGSITHNSLQPGGVCNQDNERWADHEVGIGTALLRAQYDAAATEADRTIDELLEVLSASNQLDETLVVVLADHGESLGEHGIYFEHHGLYEPTVRIPLIVRPPFESVDRSTELVSITDVAPTIAEYLDLPDLDADGTSVRPLLEGTDGWPGRDTLFFEEANTQRFRSVLVDEWKLIRAVDDPTCRYCETAHGEPIQLYDLESDPDERTNVADDHPDVVRDLEATLDNLIETAEETQDGTDEPEEIEYDDESEVLERLEELGYR